MICLVFANVKAVCRTMNVNSWLQGAIWYCVMIVSGLELVRRSLREGQVVKFLGEIRDRIHLKNAITSRTAFYPDIT
jgi:hypothetical protein